MLAKRKEHQHISQDAWNIDNDAREMMEEISGMDNHKSLRMFRGRKLTSILNENDGTRSLRTSFGHHKGNQKHHTTNDIDSNDEEEKTTNEVADPNNDNKDVNNSESKSVDDKEDPNDSKDVDSDEEEDKVSIVENQDENEADGDKVEAADGDDETESAEGDDEMEIAEDDEMGSAEDDKIENEDGNDDNEDEEDDGMGSEDGDDELGSVDEDVSAGDDDDDEIGSTDVDAEIGIADVDAEIGIANENDSGDEADEVGSAEEDNELESADEDVSAEDDEGDEIGSADEDISAEDDKDEEIGSADEDETGSTDDYEIGSSDEDEEIGSADGDDNTGSADEDEGIGSVDEDDEIGSADGDDEIGSADGDDEIGSADGDDGIGSADEDDKIGIADGDDETGNADGDDETGSADGDEEIESADGDDETGSADGDDETGSADGDDETGSADGDDETGSADGDDETGSADGDDETGSADENVDDAIEGEENDEESDVDDDGKDETKASPELRLHSSKPYNGKLTDVLPLRRYEDPESNIIGFYAEIFLGDPGQVFNVVVDTTSPDLWVPSSHCNECDGNLSLYEESDSKAWSKKSSNQNQFTTLINDESATGETAIDTLIFSDLKLPDQEFGQITKFPNGFSPFPGISGSLGLAPTPYFEDSVVEQIAHDIRDSIFSIALAVESTDDYLPSFIVFGGVSQRHYMGCIQWHNAIGQELTPQERVFKTKTVKWMFGLTKVKIGYKVSEREDIKTAVLDSTSPVISGAPKDINTFLERNFAKCFDNNHDEVECSGTTYDIATVACNLEDFAPLEFVAGDNTYTFEFKDLVNRGLLVAGYEVCTVNVAPRAGLDQWVLGLPWFNKFYTVFNLKKSEVGFAERKRDSHWDESDLCEADLDMDIDVDTAMKKIQDVVNEVIGETMDIIEEGEDVVEEAIEEVDEELDEVEEIIIENEFGNIDDNTEDYKYDNDNVENDDGLVTLADDETIAFNFTDDYTIGSGGAQSDDIFSLSTVLAKIEDEAFMVESKVEEEVNVLGVKVSATIGGCAILLILLLTVLTRRRRYGGRRPVREVRDIELQRNNFDDWQYPDDKNRFVID